MNRKVIVALIVVAIVGAVVGIYYARKAGEQLPSEKQGVYLHPELVQARCGQEVSIKIAVNPSGRGVSAGEINLSFDPSVLRAVGVEPGDFLGPNPITGLKQLDNQAGVLKLALARVGTTAVPSPAGVLATVSFQVVNSAISGMYQLELTKVGLADENFQDITGFAIQGASIRISP